MAFSRLLTLRKRIVIVFLFSSLVPFVLTAAISYATIASIQANQIQARIRTNLSGVSTSIENALDNLNHVSQQLALQGTVGGLLEQYLGATEGFDRASLRDRIKTELNLVSYTNPNVGLMMYTFGDGARHDFESSTSLSTRPPTSLPLLVKRNLISYFGPHLSLDNYNGRTVLSVWRKLDNQSFQDVSIYLETAFKFTDSLLGTGPDDFKTRYLFLDGARRAVSSDVPEVFPPDEIVLPVHRGFEARSGFLWNEVESRQGWTLVSLVAEEDYNRERDRWVGLILLLFLVFLAAGALMGTLLWRMIYRPLGVFQREMTWIENLGTTPVPPIHIPEFDRLLVQFQDMKAKVLGLMEEARTKERQKADLEIEKLLFQINPHFLMNSLATVHWLAVVHQQPEIDQYALSLTRLLGYNLGKRGKLGSLRDEIEAVQEYATLQKARFDLHFCVVLEVDDRVLDTLLPRFLLQPLVENAILHGLGDDGWVELAVKELDGIRLTVTDHGPGMPAVAEGLASGMGIGLAYVERVLDHHFDGKARIETESRPGEGTTVTVVLPC